jgi:GPH family glycoside/pentoside/hexuronide:cation symporter
LPEPLPLKAALSYTLGNQPFRMVMGLYLLSWTTASILAAVLVYFANYYLKVPEQANYIVLVAQGSAIIFIPFIVKLSQILDKRKAFIIGTISWALVCLGISTIRSDQLMLGYLLAGLSGFGIATAYVVPWSMIPDVVEHDQLRSGRRREGSYYSFASFFQKLATGAALWSMGQALAFSGYITPTTTNVLPIQPETAIKAIRIFIGPVPLVLLVIAVIFGWLYPISRERHQATLSELAKSEKITSR